MNDFELCKTVLGRFYEERRHRDRLWHGDELGENVASQDFFFGCEQLKDTGDIEWEVVARGAIDPARPGQIFTKMGRGHIKSAGVNRHLGIAESTMTTSPNITVNNSPGAVIQNGDGNTNQQISWTKLLSEKVDAANASPEEKQEAKSLIERVTANPLLNTVVGAVINGVLK